MRTIKYLLAIFFSIAVAACGNGGGGSGGVSGGVFAGGRPAGCDANRPGVMHQADGTFLGTGGLVPCSTKTFYGFGEANPVVSSNGTVMFGGSYDPTPPAGTLDPNGGHIAQTADKGATWQFVNFTSSVPQSSPAFGHHGAGDPRFWRDPLTDRIFLSIIGAAFGFPDYPDPRAFDGLCNTELAYTEDGGKTWTFNPDPENWGCPAFDFPQSFTAPRTTSPPAGLGAYPNVYYICKTAYFGPSAGRQCFKSLDSAHTLDPMPGAGAHDPRFGGIDGTIYGITGGHLHYSTDEGATWTVAAGTVVATNNRGPSVDGDGNIFSVGLVNSLPVVQYSRDKGATWSTPIAVQMPGVMHAHQPDIAVVPTAGAPGVVAVVYIGNGDAVDSAPIDLPPVNDLTSTHGPNIGGSPGGGHQGGVHHGYITMTQDIFAANPVFESLQVDSDADPLLPYGFHVGGITVAASRADYIGVYFDKARKPWAYFYKDECLTMTTCKDPNLYTTGLGGTNWMGTIVTVAPK